MTENGQAAIPQAMRELAAKNLHQARAACNQLMDSAERARKMMIAMIPANPALQGLNRAQERAMRFARQNVDAGFSLADELTRAADLPEMLQIQSRHTQSQIQSYALQAREFASGVNGAAQKKQVSNPATPSADTVASIKAASLSVAFRASSCSPEPTTACTVEPNDSGPAIQDREPDFALIACHGGHDDQSRTPD